MVGTRKTCGERRRSMPRLSPTIKTTKSSWCSVLGTMEVGGGSGRTLGAVNNGQATGDEYRKNH